jgi:hypothetical protein
MVLGSDVGLVETCSLALCGLVGRLSYRYLCNESIPEWVEHNWKRELGYAPEIRYLTKGWYGFICRSPEDSARSLAKKWMVGRSSMMIKRWRLDFNPDTESFQMRHLWVLLLGLPLHFWNAAAMEAIGKYLGSFVSLDDFVMSTPSRNMGKILVEIDIHGGLPEIMEIEWRGRRIVQRLDYLRIPFQCSYCHKTSHLRKSCKGRVEEEISKNMTLHRDLGEPEDEVNSTGFDYGFS